MALREGNLLDYLVASFVGIAFGIVMTLPSAGAAGNWGLYIGMLVVGGLFGYVPGGIVAGYLNFRFHRMGENLEMSGLSAGFFTALVYTILALINAVVGAIGNQNAAATYFIAWIIQVVFAFIFFSLGGYISGMLERRPFGMPGIFNLGSLQRAPPPPPGTSHLCPTCGSPLRYLEQYKRWYCDKEQKYV